MVSVKLEVYLMNPGGLNKTRYRMFPEMTKDTGKERSK